MFNNDRYLTRGIDSTVPIEVQSYLWYLIDSMSVSKKDYLQVFRLTGSDAKLEITHSQEVPEYEQMHSISNYFDADVSIKIFVIDSGEYSTMLLAEEY